MGSDASFLFEMLLFTVLALLVVVLAQLFAVLNLVKRWLQTILPPKKNVF